MAINFTLTWNADQLATLKGNAIDRALARAVRNAGDQAGRQASTSVVKLIRSKKRLKAGEVRKGVKLQRPGRTAAIEAMAWHIRISRDPIPLSRYPHSKTPQGVTVRVNRSGAAQKIPSAFVAKVGKGGHVGIFLRTRSQSSVQKVVSRLGLSRLLGVLSRGRLGRGDEPVKRVGRKPIRQLWGSRLSDVMQDTGAIDSIFQAAQERMATAFERGLAMQLEKLGR
jgi:hypothetical protein